MFYLVPLAVSWYLHLVLVAFVLLMAILFSFAFHAFDEREFILSDIDAALVIIIINLVLLYLGGFKPVLFVLIALLALVAIFIRFVLEGGNRGGTAHGFWHLFSALVTLLCILSYATSVSG